MNKPLRAKQVAEMLGVALVTFRRYVKRGHCPPYARLPTGIMVWDVADVTAWLSELRRGGKTSK
jgi:predicted DNA-binding transcriptional regulator AlpA